MYDAYRAPAAPPPRPPSVRKSFWTRPKVGAAGIVLGVLIGVSGTGAADPEPDSSGTTARPAEEQPAQVVEQGPSEAEVEEQVGDAVAAATDDLQEEMAAQREQAEADLEAVRLEAEATQSTAVRKAVRKALAQRPPRIVEVPVEVPAEAPAPAPAATTDPQFGTCGEANDAGYGPYRSGQDQEYGWYDDRDGDGIVCET